MQPAGALGLCSVGPLGLGIALHPVLPVCDQLRAAPEGKVELAQRWLAERPWAGVLPKDQSWLIFFTCAGGNCSMGSEASKAAGALLR